VERRKWSGADSLQLNSIRELALAVYRDSFWTAQTGQIDITAEGKFEIHPLIGDHVLRLGKGGDMNKKLRHARLFHEQVLGKAGFTKYEVVNLEFDGQVVGIHKGPQSPVDSIQLQKNIEELLKWSSTIENVRSEMLPDSAFRPTTNNNN
jgi:cell division protein FtsQ